MTTITVVEAIIDGKVVYLKGNSIFGPEPTVNPLEARDFTNEPAELEHFVAALVVPGDEFFAKSGLRVDMMPIVKTFDVTLELKHARPARAMNKA